MHILALVLVLHAAVVNPEDRAANRNISPDTIRVHVAVLAADSLEGREVGEPGEQKASAYLVSVFEHLRLQPAGDSGRFLQAFDFVKRTEFGPGNHLAINGRDLEINVDYQPLPSSGSLSFDFGEVVDVGYGIVTNDSSHNDYAGKDVSGKAVLMKRFAPDSMQPAQPADSSGMADSAHAAQRPPDTLYDRYSAVASKIATALDRGASGVFFYTPEDRDDTVITMGTTHITPKDIPIIFLRRAGLEKLGLSLAAPEVRTAVGATDLIRVRDTGRNVVGLLPGLSDSTIVIGAHYDHVGYGGQSSRYRGPERLVHNGADDNASGTSALLEIARHFASGHEPLRHSLLFIAFSGEESGLLGSSHYVRDWTVDRSKVLMMINMDMIGRLAHQEKGLAILGTGTCKEFKDYFETANMGKLKVSFQESGSGPSDHTAFYNDSIPCLAFFTGAHQDYHHPDDDIDKLDFDGIATVANLVVDIVEHFDPFAGRLAFQRTKGDSSGGRRTDLSVTLGIMPDFISEVKGLGVDGVTPDKPAERAGILRGDVIIEMGGRAIGDIYDYMNALAKYRKGDSTPIRLVRGSDTLTVTVEFK